MLNFIETKKIKNPINLAQIIYKNFIYLKDYPELNHNIEGITTTLQSDNVHIYLVYEGKELVGYSIGEVTVLQDFKTVYYLHYIYII